MLFFVVPFGLRLHTSRAINTAASTLQQKYGVDTVYDLGSATQCVRQKPTRFGDVTKTTACDVIAARLYYPKVTITAVDLSQYQAGAAKGTMSEQISYVNAQGGSLDDYISFGIITNPGFGQSSYVVDQSLGFRGREHVDFAGVYGTADTSGSSTIGGKWYWDSSSTMFGPGSSAQHLQQDIDSTILADQAPVAGAPKPSQALQQGRAPLVAYITMRYCHGPGVVVLDNFCVLPN